MSNVPESESYDNGIYQLETVDEVLGGVNGKANAQAKGLANRTRWLKAQVDALNLLKGKGVASFSIANSYVAGEIVDYQKNIYRANTTITPGAWNASQWNKLLGTAAESELASVAPLVNGAAAVGTSTLLARQDHVHPTDTTRAPLASPVLTGAPAAPTPAQFDNDTSIATTEFVQRALGNLRSTEAIAANITLLPSDAGKLYHLAGLGTSYLVTLPALASVPDGATFAFVCTNPLPGTAGITPANGETFTRNDGSTGTSPTDKMVFTVGQTLIITKRGAAWFWVSGTKAIASSGFFGASLAANGYQKLPSGLIVQWGVVNIPGAGSQVAATLPITFPNACLMAYASLSNGLAPAIYLDAVGNASTVTIRANTTIGAGAISCAYFCIGW